MIKSKHTLDYCYGCECFMVRCVTCNNNSCNAVYGSGSGPDGRCVDCPSAYDDQDAFWEDGTSVEFVYFTDEAKEERIKQEWRFEKPKTPTRKEFVHMISFIKDVQKHLAFKKREGDLEWGEESLLSDAECLLKKADVVK